MLSVRKPLDLFDARFNGPFFIVHCLYSRFMLLFTQFTPFFSPSSVYVCIWSHQFCSAFAIFPYFSCIIFVIIFGRIFNHLVFEANNFCHICRVLFVAQNNANFSEKSEWEKKQVASNSVNGNKTTHRCATNWFRFLYFPWNFNRMNVHVVIHKFCYSFL